MLAFSAINNNDKVGVIFFSEEVEKYIPPKKGKQHILRIIREVEPPRPSTRLSGLLSGAESESGTLAARRRRLDPRSLTRHLRGDLDWIVMKALEKDRTRRYDTASSLAVDIQRFLHDEPVAARRPSTGYRMHKFVYRNRGLVAAIAARCASIATRAAKRMAASSSAS